MMIYPPITKLVEKTGSRYLLVVETAKRARQLIDGADPLVTPTCNKALSIAVDELYQSKVKIISEEKEN